MARFDMEQTMAIAAVQQLINDWANELDLNNGLEIPELLTADCVYMLGATPYHGPAAVGTFYRERLARLSAQPDGVPTQRHILSNLRSSFTSADAVSITFSLVYFTTAGMASGLNHADPAAVADVRMDCRREADGHWRIAMFDSAQTFRRTPA
jgi:hypothetical protein